MTAYFEALDYMTVPSEVDVVELDLAYPQVLNIAYDLDRQATVGNVGILPVDSPEELREFLCDRHPGSKTFGAVNPDLGLIGYATISPVATDPEGKPSWVRTELLNIAAHPDRNVVRGIGSRLLAFCMTAAREYGAHRFDLRVSPENKDAIIFYIRRGLELTEFADSNYYGPNHGQRALLSTNVCQCPLPDIFSATSIHC
jgi:ribosomal protein S18 acetylase RimI-like enzyme